MLCFFFTGTLSCDCCHFLQIETARESQAPPIIRHICVTRPNFEIKVQNLMTGKMINEVLSWFAQSAGSVYVHVPFHIARLILTVFGKL